MITDYPRIYLVTAVITGLLFLLFIFLFYPPSFLRLKIFPSLRRGSVVRVMLERLTGFLFFGVIPFLILYKTLPAFHGADLGIVLPSRSWFLPSLIFWVLIVFVVSRVADSPASLEQYPQMRQVIWTPAMVFLNALTWALYLAGYEFFFRGLLLFPLLPDMGLIATLALNLALYALAHLHKGWREVGGSLAFGTVLVLATIYSGSLLLSFFSHLVLALSNGFFAARATRKKHSHG
jgi:membrane protease YdiL (CAAX protease family)